VLHNIYLIPMPLQDAILLLPRDSFPNHSSCRWRCNGHKWRPYHASMHSA